ncbi:MAG: asparagine synthase-related protein [Candidatus Pacearchaeota archaeon]
MVTYKTDWLASRPVFYNEKTNKVSYDINEVIDFRNLEFHPEGLNNYLDFGYSILGQTPIKNVKFLRHSSEITIDRGKIKIKELEDPVSEWLKNHQQTSKEEEVINLLMKKIHDWEKSSQKKIVLPLSGGYDSRLLAYLIKDKSKLNAFTFGVSKKQEKSYEVIHAKKLCKKLGIKWGQIKLGDFHKYIDEWIKIFGPSVHAHGMYHLEFYKKIAEEGGTGHRWLSGIFGDVWAGSTPKKIVKSYKDLREIGYTHGLNADANKCKIKTKFELRKKFFRENKDIINDEIFQIVNLIRLKIILISYLMTLPRKEGFLPWSPFLDLDVAMSMLTINKNRRKKRLWQKDFFKKVGLDFESSLFFKKTTSNRLNYEALRRISLKPLNVKILSEIIEEDYLNWINKTLSQETIKDKIIERILTIQKFGGFIRRYLKIKDKRITAYYAYLTIKPLEEVLIKKELYNRK